MAMTHDELLVKINYLVKWGPHVSNPDMVNALRSLRSVVELHHPFTLDDDEELMCIVCAECCIESEEYQTEACANTHEHRENASYCPKTIPAIEKELQ